MANANPYRFSTKYEDESGLVYYGFRYYSPELGRWVSRDLIEEDGGVNLYCFVINNAISLTDFIGWKWNVIRSRELYWAVAYSDAESDTFYSLADKVNLDYDSRIKWLKAAPRGSSSLPLADYFFYKYVSEFDTATKGCYYKLPNVIQITQGDTYNSQPSLFVWDTWRKIKKRAGRFKSDMENRGYKVINNYSETRDGLSFSKIASVLAEDYVYGWGHFGHGLNEPWGKGLKIMGSYYNFFARNPRLGIVVIYSCFGGHVNWNMISAKGAEHWSTKNPINLYGVSVKDNASHTPYKEWNKVLTKYRATK